MTTSLLLFLALLFLSQTHGLTPKRAIPDEGSTLQVLHFSSFHRQDPLSWEARVLQTQSKDDARVRYLASLVAGKSVVLTASARPNYVVKANIGTPPQTVVMALDNSNDAAWIACAGCVGCSKALFDSSKSTTFKALGCQAAQCKQVPSPTCAGSACSFNMTYGGSTLAANLSQDTIKLATDAVPGYTFGCIQKATGSFLPPQGLLGLGRGPWSLLSQTHPLYQSTFSYCLPSFKSDHFSGSLRLGPIGQPKRIKTTQLLRNPRRSQLYYVNMIGIRVGRRVLNIPPSALAFNPTTGAGTIFDSGTVFTRLVKPAYVAVRHAFRKRVGANLTVTSLGGFDTCYSGPIPAPPTITFMFAGMNVTLPPDNFLIHSSAGSTTCLAMAAAPDAPDNVNSVLNVIASMQQQNHRVLFDVPNSRLGVAREFCS
ncbi:eukaryotic aspartyl protease family protein [Actinidia rufa]|uniref:Eukaryotic aspartyl protease family protein n=1 Tax=Actinidia rufa TaxID=165716 RepID=A0A7J0FAR1_9ERIC|nr:eukaryotic aspartyl protease family protein [Actinidia rufa]